MIDIVLKHRSSFTTPAFLMYKTRDFVVRAYIRNRYPVEGYRATRSRGPLDQGATPY